ncbi:hypothetical protein JVU11DRAFT_6904 [Chiua virens]|nr:hypothetical protein JVU11DRAFT_6904 [Chiua virens]
MSPSIVIASSQSSITVNPRRSPSSVTHSRGLPISQLALAWSPVYLLPPVEPYVLQDSRAHWSCIRHPSFAPRSPQSQGQLPPPSNPTDPHHLFCSITCSQYAALFAPQLKYLPPHHELSIRVVNQFIQRWTSSPCPKVLAVYMTTRTDASRRGFEQYRDAVEARGRFSYMGLSPGNEQKQFRSTNRACTLGECGNVTPCHNQACWMCETIRFGFEPHLLRKRSHGVGVRLGAGIYTGYASSKADDYANNSHDPNSTVRAMLVCRVVIGKPYEMYQNDPTFRRPPPGYDSVLGRSIPGSAFTEDEYVVYDADAIRPAYLIVYEKASNN